MTLDEFMKAVPTYQNLPTNRYIIPHSTKGIQFYDDSFDDLLLYDVPCIVVFNTVNESSFNSQLNYFLVRNNNVYHIIEPSTLFRTYFYNLTTQEKLNIQALELSQLI